LEKRQLDTATAMVTGRLASHHTQPIKQYLYCASGNQAAGSRVWSAHRSTYTITTVARQLKA
jgi:hypothetical protein